MWVEVLSPLAGLYLYHLPVPTTHVVGYTLPPLSGLSTVDML